MTSNLASDEIAQHALQIRDEAREIHKQRSDGKLGESVLGIVLHGSDFWKKMCFLG